MPVIPVAACEGLVDGPRGVVVSVTDGDTVVLDSGLVIRLIGMQAPKLALGREDFPDWPKADDAKAALEALAARHEWLGVAVSEHRLIADVAQGYDVVVMGADKWAQVLDPSYHPSEADWRASLARLPRVAVARRGEHPIEGDVLVLDVDLGEVSSTAVREGREEWRASTGSR